MYGPSGNDYVVMAIIIFVIGGGVCVGLWELAFWLFSHLHIVWVSG